jgi:hypothetical protein
MIRWAVSRLLGDVCPACECHFRDLDRHWAVDHGWFGMTTRPAAA